MVAAEHYEAAIVAALAYEGDQTPGDHFLHVPPFLAIRGSDDLTDWWSNLHVKRIAGLHSGFLRASYSLQAEIHDRIKPDTIFVGHSRGGAIAQILAEHYDRPAITFGAPKVGNCTANVTAYVNSGDAVPLLPLSYRRHSDILYLREGKVIRNPSTALMLFDIVTRRGVQHTMDSYLESLEECNETRPEEHQGSGARYSQSAADQTQTM